MARSTTPKRHMEPDYRYQDTRITKFINCMMMDGKKNLAQRKLFQAFDIIKEKTEKEPMETFEKALEHVTPTVEVKPKRIGGANIQIPIEVRKERKYRLFVRLVLKAARARKEKTIEERLAMELLEASKGAGKAVKARMNMDKVAEAHRAYAHLR